MRDARSLLLAALWLAGAAHAQTAFSVRSNLDDHLYEIDLATGLATDLGLIGLNDAEGVSHGPGGRLYAIGGTVNEFWDITTPPGVLVGATGPRAGIDAGLDFHNGVMHHTSAGIGTGGLYTVDLATGLCTLVAPMTAFADNIAIHPTTGVAYGIDAIFNDNVFTIDLTTGIATPVGLLGIGNVSQQAGSAFSGGTLYALFGDGNLYKIDLTTGQASLVTQVRNAAGAILTGWEGLATVEDTCYPDCNNSGTLTIADFGCFQAAFANNDPYADCNNSGTLTIADFGCFQAAFAAGCP
jgi:hypothetical protein